MQANQLAGSSRTRGPLPDSHLSIWTREHATIPSGMLRCEPGAMYAAPFSIMIVTTAGGVPAFLSVG